MRKVDQSGQKTAQALTILLLLAAFILNSPLLVAIVAISQILGALDVEFGPFRVFYKTVAQRFIKPNVITDNPEPHRFAMLVGSIFNGVATLALLSGASSIGWVLVWIVIVLANLNFWLNICVGCLMYYQLNRFGVPGFKYAPLHD